jgi:hypothetical protein
MVLFVPFYDNFNYLFLRGAAVEQLKAKGVREQHDVVQPSHRREGAGPQIQEQSLYALQASQGILFH